MSMRKGHKVSVKASVRAAETKSIFLDLKEDTTTQVRFLPPANSDGSVFTKIVNHFKLVTDDNPPRGMALACRMHHEDDECVLCALSRHLKRDGDKHEKQIGDDIRPSARFYAQVLRMEKDADGTTTYEGPYLIGLPKTAVETINAILIDQDSNEEPFFCDIGKGQDLRITRTGTGFSTRYNIRATGVMNDLDDICPEWEDRYIQDVVEAVGLHRASNEDMLEAARRTFGDDLDWNHINDKLNLQQ